MNYISNFLEILQRVSGTTIELLDADQPLSELIDGELVDTDDFDTALVAFEITNRVVVDCEDLSGEEIGGLSVRSLLDTHLIESHPDLENPFFAADRIIALRESLVAEFDEDDEEEDFEMSADDFEESDFYDETEETDEEP